LPRPDGLAMTAWGDTPENLKRTHLGHSRPLFVIARRCSPDAAIQRERPMPSATVIPRNHQVTYFLSFEKHLTVCLKGIHNVGV
jgi:hypothetical protein